jgi:hypothetical protein
MALGDASPTTGLGESDFVVIQHLIIIAFRLYPKVVLSTCFEGFRSSQKEQFQAAHWVFGNLLLASYPTGSSDDVSRVSDDVRTEAAAKDTSGTGHVNGTKQHLLNGVLRPAQPGNANGMPAGVPADSDEKGKVIGKSMTPLADGSTSPSTCLAEVVLSSLPDTKQWLKGAIINLSKGGCWLLVCHMRI